MYEPHVASQFTRDTITTYNRLYETFVASRDRGAPIHGPQFDANDWNGFETGTIACLSSVQGRGGVPSSYMLRSDVLCPLITIASSEALRFSGMLLCEALTLMLTTTVYGHVSYVNVVRSLVGDLFTNIRKEVMVVKHGLC